MARKNYKNFKSNTMKVEASDPGLGFSPARQCASMARSDSRNDVEQRGRKNARAYSKHGWKKEY